MITMQGDCLIKLWDLPEQYVDMAFICLPKSSDGELDAHKLFTALGRVMKSISTIVFHPPVHSLIRARLVLAADAAGWSVDENMGIKPQGTDPLRSGYRPMTQHQPIIICRRFPKKGTFNPRYTKGKPYAGFSSKTGATIGAQYGNRPSMHRSNPSGQRCMTSVFLYRRDPKARQFHDDAQPAEVCERFIATFSNPGDVILDCCMGSGTTGVVALNLGRDFVGIERNPRYYETAVNRLREAREGVHA